MALCAFTGWRVGIKPIRTHHQTTTVGLKEKIVCHTRSGIQTLFSIVLTSFAFQTACLTNIKNACINELTNRACDPTCIRPDVFIVVCVRYRSWQICIHRDSCDVLTTLTMVKPRFRTSSTPISAFGAFIVVCVFIEVGGTILYALIALQVDFGSVVGEPTWGALFRVIDTGFAVGVTDEALETGGIGISSIHTSIRTWRRSINEEMIDIVRILLTSCARTIRCPKAQSTSQVAGLAFIGAYISVQSFGTHLKAFLVVKKISNSRHVFAVLTIERASVACDAWRIALFTG